MRHTADAAYPFDPDNRVWPRLLAVTGEHFDTVAPSRRVGRPVLLALPDPATGHVGGAVDDLTSHRRGGCMRSGRPTRPALQPPRPAS